MIVRIVTGLVLAPLVLALVGWGPWWGVALALVAVGGLAAAETHGLVMRCHAAGRERPARWARVAAASVAAAVVGAATVWGPAALGPALAVGAAAVMLLALPAAGDMPAAGARFVAGLATVAYVGALWGMLGAYHALGDPGWRGALFALFGVVWLGDTGAYFTGRAVGRHALAPRISPKKTWEGTVGGLLASIAGVFVVQALFGLSDLPASRAVAIGLGAGVVEQLGDLCESLLKRAAGAKDSGALLPGHGGMLDRIDGMLFAAPLVYFLWPS